MTTAYNPMYTHRLEPISGFDEITHLQFIAPMNEADLTRNNGSGEEFGLPAGSVVSVDPSTNAFRAGATGTEMPCFLLWNTSDPDGYPSALTANGQHLAGIPGTGAARVGQGSVLDSAELIRNLYQKSSATLAASGTTTQASYVNATTGDAGSINSNGTSYSNSGSVISYNLRKCAGAFTAWPATCGLELDSTEFDKSISSANYSTAFAPNTLLTAPKAIAVGDLAGTETEEVKCQKLRGGYLKPLVNTGTSANTDFVAAASFGASTSKAVDFVNVCGTVSKGIHRNENGVLVLYFWAERTIFPKVYLGETNA